MHTAQKRREKRGESKAKRNVISILNSTQYLFNPENTFSILVEGGAGWIREPFGGAHIFVTQKQRQQTILA
jgi:hypothetical protein